MEKNITKQFTTKNQDETYNFGLEFGKNLVGGETILMYGEAGAGKTVFTKGVAVSLGVKERVTSPTFALKNQYDGEKFTLHHLDMYRIEDEDEAYESGALEGISESGSVTILEWAENVENFFNFPHINIRIEYLSANDRQITVENIG